MIGDLNEASVGTIGKFMLLNSHGYWLKGLDTKDEWGFMYDDRKDRTLAAYDFEGWEKITTQESGQFSNKKGVYTFTTIHPITRGMVSSTGSGGAFNASEKRYSSDEYYWKVISFVPSDILHEQLALVHSLWMLAYVLILVLSGFLASKLQSTRTDKKELIAPEVWRSRFGDSSAKRYIVTFMGGVLVLLGARLAGGCTSGHMMSGMMQTSLSGYLFAMGAFALAIPVAIFMYKEGK